MLANYRVATGAADYILYCAAVVFVLTGLFYICSFDDGDFDDAEEDEGLDDLENAEDVSEVLKMNYKTTLKLASHSGINKNIDM